MSSITDSRIQEFQGLLEEGRLISVEKVCKYVIEDFEMESYDDGMENILDFFLNFLHRMFGELTMLKADDETKKWKTIQGGFGGWLKRIHENPARGKKKETKERIIKKMVVALSDLKVMMSLGNITIPMNPKCLPFKVQQIIFNPSPFYSNTLTRNLQVFRLNDQSSWNRDRLVNWQMLSTTEYFLISLVRYPTTDKQIFGVNDQNWDLSASFFDVRTAVIPYMELLKSYLKFFFDTPMGVPADNPNGIKLLKIATEYWLDTGLLVRKDFEAYFGEQRCRLPSTTYEPTDVVLFDSQPVEWTVPVCKCLNELITHLLRTQRGSPKISLQRGFSEWTEGNATFRSSMDEALNGHARQVPYIQFLQQPLFDMLRVTFSTASAVPNSLREAVDLWLLYIQPWSLATKVAKAGQDGASGCFSDEWAPYVAANLHFYTTLPVMALNAILAADMLDPSCVAGSAYFHILLKILQVFQADSGLVGCVNRLEQSFRQWYPRSGSLRIRKPSEVASPGAFQSNSGDDAEMYAIMLQHHDLYPDPLTDGKAGFGIPSCLSDCAVSRQRFLAKLKTIERDCDKSWSRYGSIFMDVKAGSIEESYLVKDLKLAIKILKKDSAAPGAGAFGSAGGRNMAVDDDEEELDHNMAGFASLADSDENRWDLLDQGLTDLSDFLNMRLGVPAIEDSKNLTVTEIAYAGWSKNTLEEKLTFWRESFHFNLRWLSHKIYLYILMAVYFVVAILIGQGGSADSKKVLLLGGLLFAILVAILETFNRFGKSPNPELYKYVDEFTGELTHEGREAVRLGRYMRDKRLVRLRIDPLTRDYGAAEWSRTYVNYLSRLSMALNELLGLPKIADSAVYSYDEVFKRAMRGWRTENPLRAAAKCFRINLRGLGDGRCQFALLLILFSWRYCEWKSIHPTACFSPIAQTAITVCCALVNMEAAGLLAGVFVCGAVGAQPAVVLLLHVAAAAHVAFWFCGFIDFLSP